MILNYETETLRDMYDFINDLQEQPEFFLFNQKQNTCIIASEDDGLLINMEIHEELDLDAIFNISDIKKVIHDGDFFYVLSNKRN